MFEIELGSDGRYTLDVSQEVASRYYQRRRLDESFMSEADAKSAAERYADQVQRGGKYDRIVIEPSWKARVGDYLLRPEMRELSRFLRLRKFARARIFPPANRIFAAFDATPFDAVKVAILGQDPYHGYGQANGLCFSVSSGEPPPSLESIFEEINADLGFQRPDHGYLMPWAKQGVLMLNAILTVEEGRAGAHRGKGWEGFTDHVVETLSREREHIVFMLWGNDARAKEKIVDAQRHCVLRAPHPSARTEHGGFVGCRHFSAANRYLQVHGQAPIDWRLPMRAELRI